MITKNIYVWLVTLATLMNQSFLLININDKYFSPAKLTGKVKYAQDSTFFKFICHILCWFLLLLSCLLTKGHQNIYRRSVKPCNYIVNICLTLVLHFSFIFPY